MHSSFRFAFSILLLAAAVPLQAQSPPAGQPDLTEIKSDFMPGAKTLFFDDYSDMTGDEPPPHWKVRGGSVALKTGEGIRQLTIKSDRVRLTPMIKQLPKNFTVETEVKFDNTETASFFWYFHDTSWDGPLGPDAALTIVTKARENGVNILVRHMVDGNLEDIANKAVPVDLSKPFKHGFWIQNGRLRVYINDQRVVDVNQVTLPQLSGAELYSEFGEDRIGYRLVRFAESTPDFSQVITSKGRYVTHAILFDTDSDRLKPESAPVIRAIAQGLQKDSTLKLQIEGHTDSTGSAAHNLELSKKRADAVKSVLVSQFGIAAERLTTSGLGSTKPLDSNETASGRAKNRRVEFGKI